jgi:hypothetical protein
MKGKADGVRKGEIDGDIRMRSGKGNRGGRSGSGRGGGNPDSGELRFETWRPRSL